VSLFAHIAIHEINNLHGQLEDRILTYELTGFFNRSSLTSSIEQAIAQQQRSGIPMTLIAFDVDHFRSINDTLGHPAGDAVLTGLGNLLRARSRKTDKAFRMGFEEFLILLHNNGPGLGRKIAEDFRCAVELAPLLPERQVTISVGVSSLEESMDSDSWTRSRYKKLYRAKQGGRNPVVA